MIILPKGSRDLIRNLNYHLILTLLRKYAPIAQHELARLSQLSPATVSGIIADLAVAGWIEEVGFGEATGRRGGRKPVLLRLNARAGLVVGVKVMEHSIATVITDLDANVLHMGEALLELPVHTDEQSTPSLIVAAMLKAIEAILRESGEERQHILGIGVGISGLVDAREGICRVSRIFPGQRDVPLAELLSEQLALPVFIDNDVRARSIALQAFGDGGQFQNFLVVVLGRGIGSSIVSNGQIYRGAGDGSGELGHMCMDEQGPLCECGHHGCLEAMAADPVLISQAKQVHMKVDGEPVESVDALARAAEQGDVFARKLLTRAGHLVGIGIANAVNLLSPECVFVVGEGTSAGEWLLGPLRDGMQAHIFPGLKPELVVKVETSTDQAWARGAACIVLNSLFKPPIST